MTSKTANQETRVPSPSTPCILTAYHAVIVGLSVSVTLVYCIQMAEGIVKLLCHPGSPIILVVIIIIIIIIKCTD